jgi:hypothetical protein
MKRYLPLLLSCVTVCSLCACNMPRSDNDISPTPNVIATYVAITLASFTQSPAIPALASPIPELLTKTPSSEATATATLTITPTFTTTATFTMMPTPTITLTSSPTETPIPKPGTIEGGITGYPYGSIPRLTIVAFGQEPPYNYSYWITAPGSTYYEMTSEYLLPGKYQVVAYDAAGHKGGCPGIVAVKGDQRVTCDITDWGGSYPAKPSGVPDP